MTSTKGGMQRLKTRSTLGRIAKIALTASSNEPPVRHPQDSVCSMGQLLVVRDDDNGLACLFSELKKQVVQQRGVFRVQVA